LDLHTNETVCGKVDKTDEVILTNNGFEEITPIVEKPKSPIVKTKTCRVINYIESHGLLGFDFDGINCQISIKPFTKIGNSVDIKYTGKIGKDIEFFL